MEILSEEEKTTLCQKKERELPLPLLCPRLMIYDPLHGAADHLMPGKEWEEERRVTMIILLIIMKIILMMMSTTNGYFYVTSYSVSLT